MFLLIDNFDSFTYNLVHAFRGQGVEVSVIRNHAKTVHACLKMKPQGIIIGPGPKTPKEAGISLPLMQASIGKIPVLGICLGHQCLATLFGGTVERAKKAVHGKTSRIHHTNQGVFSGMPQGFLATRYHSLVCRRDDLPDKLEVTAETSDGEIMGLKHREYSLEGVQFHPESVQTESGDLLLRTWINSITL